MRPLQLQNGFIDLVDRVFSYDQIKKRLIGASSAHTDGRMRLPSLVQMGMYYKLFATLKMTGDQGGARFLQDLKPYIQSGAISMFSVLIQLDQHDFAVRNRMTLAEHRYNLDVPSWEERPQQGRVDGGLATAVAASVR
jgi:hypothetical protein